MPQFLFHWEGGSQQKRKMEEKGREMVGDVREGQRTLEALEAITSGGVQKVDLEQQQRQSQ